MAPQTRIKAPDMFARAAMLILNLEKELKINGLMFVCLFLNEI
jgi:hypothetical protein